MAAPLILSISEAVISFGKKPLFEDLSFNIHAGDKICLVGRNGAGKTTLMNLIHGNVELDSGKRWQNVGVTIGYLEQDIKFQQNQTVAEFISSGFLVEKADEDRTYLINMIALPLEIDINQMITNLSGGQLRRAALAKALLEDPDLLLLDEPTNHLDFEAVKWLENYLKSCRSSVLCISHDRTFLKNISNKVFWLDRARIRVCPGGYEYFESWVETILDHERRELENRERILQKEIEWANRGIPGRRKRNMKRMEDMKKEREKLKADKSLYRQTMQKIELDPMPVEMSSKVIAEFIKVNKKFEQDSNKKVILENFNLRILRGDRIGILGKNGSGKSSLLKLLLGEFKTDNGKVKLAKNIDISYFDQNRSSLKPNESLWKNLCPNGDYVDVMGKSRHVCGYLKDFLFDPKHADDLVSSLSGGQRNRLMLAKVLANPGDLLILDEPTNDLDMDTLDMLENILSNYNGTLVVVSHDRDFLDQMVNKIIVFEGDGKVECYIGGYSDYLEAIKPEEQTDKKEIKKEEIDKKIGKKLTYKLQFELDNIPSKIKALSVEAEKLHKKFSDPEFLNSDIKEKEEAFLRSSRITHEIENLEIRWLELEEMKENL